jgi:hypothetical protein
VASHTIDRRETGRVIAPAPLRDPARRGSTAYRLFPCFGLLLFLAILVAVGPGEIFPDSWFALDGARELLQHGFSDQNTWTRYGTHEWVNQQWAAHLGFYAAWWIGGSIALVTFNILLVVSGLALCVHSAMRGGSPAWTTAVLIAVLVGVNSDLWFARAQSYSVLCFGVLAWLLTRDDGRLDRHVFLAIPLIAVWTNLHAASLVGAGICGVYALVCLIQPGPRVRPLLGRAVLFGSTACLACLATPFVGGMPWYVQHTLANSDFARFLPEWHPTTLAGSPVFVIGAFVVLAIVVRSPIGRLDTLIVAALTIAGFVAWRSELWACLWWLVVLPSALERVRPVSPGRTLHRIAVGLALVSSLALVAAFAQDLYRGDTRFATAWPRPAALIVQQAVRADPGLRVYADQPLADWLLYNAPAVRGRLATDGRYEVFSHRMFEEVDALTKEPMRIGPMVADEDLYVLSPHPWGDPALIRALERERGVVVLYRSGEAVILRRT